MKTRKRKSRTQLERDWQWAASIWRDAVDRALRKIRKSKPTAK
jgi:hypothetical protein